MISEKKRLQTRPSPVDYPYHLVDAGNRALMRMQRPLGQRQCLSSDVELAMSEHSLGKVDARGAEDCPYSLFTVTSETPESAESTVEKRRKSSSFRSQP